MSDSDTNECNYEFENRCKPDISIHKYTSSCKMSHGYHRRYVVHSFLLSSFHSFYRSFCNFVFLISSFPSFFVTRNKHPTWDKHRNIILKQGVCRAPPRRGGPIRLLFSIIKSQVGLGRRIAKAPTKTVTNARRPVIWRASEIIYAL